MLPRQAWFHQMKMLLSKLKRKQKVSPEKGGELNLWYKQSSPPFSGNLCSLVEKCNMLCRGRAAPGRAKRRYSVRVWTGEREWIRPHGIDGRSPPLFPAHATQYPTHLWTHKWGPFRN